MLPHKLQVKLLLTDDAQPDETQLVKVFHDWIKQGTLKELMIDVADYSHVPEGPSVLLVGHGSDYALDEVGGERGLLYVRKREAPPERERLRDAFRRALNAAVLLSKDSRLNPALRFRTDRMLFRVADRLAAPNTPETFERLKPELEAFGKELFVDGGVELASVGTPKQMFTLEFRAPGAADATTLLGRLGGPF